MNKIIDAVNKVFSAKVFRWVFLVAMLVAAVSDNLGLLVAAGTFYVVNEVEYMFTSANFKHHHRIEVNAPEGFEVELVESETEVAEK